MRSEPVLIVMSILAGLQLLVTSADWLDIMPTPWGKLSALVVAAVTAGMGFYVRQRVTPTDP